MEREQAAVAGEDRVGDDAAPWQRHLAPELERRRVAQLEPRVAVLVLVHERVRPRVVDLHAEIPRALEHDLPRPRSHVVAGDRGRVPADARREQERAPVRKPRGRADVGRLVVRRDLDPVARLDVYEQQQVVGRALGEARDSDQAPVGREATGRVVPAAEVVHTALLPALERAHDDVEVDFVAAVRRVHEQAPVTRDARVRVHEARVVHERLGLVARVEQVELLPLVAGRVHLEQDALAAGQKAPGHRLIEVGQPLEQAARARHPVQLHRPREIRGDEHRLAVPGEIRRHRNACLEEIAEGQH